ncbi:MAG TPA: DUF1549 and DUF1553 domain-containing protein [Candidatus Binatia bacterium]|nr:DUF1549 and DUF1553 domain-containing protein [Candidatus Binatia bacterium]
MMKLSWIIAVVFLLVATRIAIADEVYPRDWAFRPGTCPAVPQVKAGSWCRNPIDNFILEKLETKGLTPSPEADRRTLLRRLSFDVTGLPPTLDEVTEFMKSRDPLAYERAVDRLLASPRYGERWARHWLDTVHFAETHGYDKDKLRPNAWPYRDYVIRAFNSDKPYSRFVQEQIAGDALFPNEAEAIVATGFLAAGPWDYVGHVELPESKMDGLIARYNDRDDMVMTVMSTFQSLTVHCARCHDHKFDPLTQEDYYSLQAVFAGVSRADRAYPIAGGKTGLVYAAAAHFKGEGQFKPSPAPRAIHRLIRGDVRRPGAVMEPGAIAVFTNLTHAFRIADPADEAARRAALAEWITDTNNFNTRRSIVNRVWQYHFGRGIVETPNDFGHMGSAPSHPELLDWLADWFLKNGESIKALHRLILASATYRQTSANDLRGEQIDAENRSLWRMNRTRLDAEQVHDAILALSSKLDLTMGGPSVRQFFFKDDHSPVYDYTRYDIDSLGSGRRGVYRFIVRSVTDPLMDTLDCADPCLLTPRRNTTTTALQALAMLNSSFVTRHAEHFAERLRRADSKLIKHIEAAYWLVFSRAPTDLERNTAMRYTEKHGLANFSRLLFNSNEFMFVD